jgi:hypothetical protein
MPRRSADAQTAFTNSEWSAMPRALFYSMIAVWLAIMITIKLVVAPWIVHDFGWLGVAVTLALIFAAAWWLED